ncbi:MAG: hypothetical protein AAFZ15_10865 [Bacteroidota bacterium]
MIDVYNSWIQRWQNAGVDKTKIGNLLFYNRNARIHAPELYRLLNADLGAILNSSANQVRLHFAAKPVDPHQAKPAFTIIIDSFSSNANETVGFNDLHDNAKEMEFIFDSAAREIPLGKRDEISQDEAHAFDSSYLSFADALSGNTLVDDTFVGTYFLGTVNGSEELVRGFNLSDSDVAKMRAKYENEEDINLFVYITAAVSELVEGDPFSVRPVLMLARTFTDYSNALYFEYSRPCPPICDTFVDSSLPHGDKK